MHHSTMEKLQQVAKILDIFCTDLHEFCLAAVSLNEISDWLSYNIQLDSTQVILETSYPANHLRSTKETTLNKTKQTCIGKPEDIMTQQ